MQLGMQSRLFMYLVVCTELITRHSIHTLATICLLRMLFVGYQYLDKRLECMPKIFLFVTYYGCLKFRVYFGHEAYVK